MDESPHSRELQWKFVDELCDHIKDLMLRNIEDGATPQDWGGAELRWWLVEKAKRNAEWHDTEGDKARLRKRRFKHELDVLGLV